MDVETLFPPDVGYVYALTNPVWPNAVKLGLAGSVKRRWFSYQTGDPYRAYRMLGWSDAILNPRDAEKLLHERFAAQRIDDSREWFRISEADALAALNLFRKQPLGAPMPAQITAEEIPGDWYDDDAEVGSAWE